MFVAFEYAFYLMIALAAFGKSKEADNLFLATCICWVVYRTVVLAA